MDPTLGLVVFLGSVFWLGLVAIIGGFLHGRRERMLTHTERMKALEMGLPLPDAPDVARLKAIHGTGGSSDEEVGATPQLSLARTCYKTALWVAFWGFLFSAQGSVMNFANGVALAVGISTGAVCVTCVICGTILAARAPAPYSMPHHAKHQTDPDVFDVVGRRG
jgi:hypothetical protein